MQKMGSAEQSTDKRASDSDREETDPQTEREGQKRGTETESSLLPHDTYASCKIEDLFP